MQFMIWNSIHNAQISTIKPVYVQDKNLMITKNTSVNIISMQMLHKLR